eukprot:m.165896 g.165896  ORF g.165896 m.165896 type:complete len:186 (+) comp15268_c0_seq10:127-684(+)
MSWILYSRCAAPASSLLKRLSVNTAEQTTFIEKAKLFGCQSLLGLLVNRGGFDSAFSNLEITQIGGGEARARMKVLPSHCNAFGTLHGGASSTLVDIMGTLAILSLDPTRPGVSVDINVTFVSAAKVHTEIEAIGKALKVGKRMGFTDVEIRRVEDSQLVASGRHTKAFITLTSIVCGLLIIWRL